MAALDTPKTRLAAVCIWGFLGLWIYFFSFSLYASGCHDFKRPADERLRRCENSLRFTGFAYTKHQQTMNLLNQGIAQAELAEKAKALALFDEAIILVGGKNAHSFGRGSWKFNALLRTMANPDIPPQALQLFKIAISARSSNQS